jgi:hypothetical protein
VAKTKKGGPDAHEDYVMKPKLVQPRSYRPPSRFNNMLRGVLLSDGKKVMTFGRPKWVDEKSERCGRCGGDLMFSLRYNPETNSAPQSTRRVFCENCGEIKKTIFVLYSTFRSQPEFKQI